MGKFLRAIGLEKLSEAPLGDYSADVTPPTRADASRIVTTDRALTLPAVFRAVQIIAGMGAQLTLDSWRGGSRVEPAPALVTQPDPWRSLSSFLERVIICLAIAGNAFLLKSRGADGSVVALEALNPDHVFIERSPLGVKSFRVWNPITGKWRPYTTADIEHVWALEVPGHDRGLSPVEACRVALGGILEVREYADAWFQSGDVPSGVLTTDQKLDRELAKEYKRRWLNLDDDDPAFGKAGPQVRVMGAGLSYSPIALKPADAQWLESQAFGVLDVARMFGLPGDYLLAAVEGSSLTYANLEMIDAQFLRTTLFPVYLRKIEAAISSVLPRGQEARFNTEALLRPDAKTRAEIDQIYLTNDVISAKEIREREGWAGPAPAPRPKPAPAPVSQEVPAK